MFYQQKRAPIGPPFQLKKYMASPPFGEFFCNRIERFSIADISIYVFPKKWTPETTPFTSVLSSMFPHVFWPKKHPKKGVSKTFSCAFSRKSVKKPLFYWSENKPEILGSGGKILSQIIFRKNMPLLKILAREPIPETRGFSEKLAPFSGSDGNNFLIKIPFDLGFLGKKTRFLWENQHLSLSKIDLSGKNTNWMAHFSGKSPLFSSFLAFSVWVYGKKAFLYKNPPLWKIGMKLLKKVGTIGVKT